MIKTPQRLFLLDAYALIFRAYYAFIRSPRINSRGENTSAIFGFALMLDEILDSETPDMIAVAFDPPGGTFRHEAYPDYKAHRDETPEAIRFAVPYIKRLLEAYRIPILEVAGYEADDVIGTLARRAEASGQDLEVLMVTPDKDYGQLVSPRVRMYRPMQGGGYETWGEAEICAKFGLSHTGQVLDYLALVGDSADNLPGCPRIGDKTAQKLLGQYGSIEGIYAHLAEIKGKTKEYLEAGRASTEMTRELATICTSVPIEFSPELYVRQELDAEALKALYTELEFRTLMGRIATRTGRTAAEGAASTSTSDKGTVSGLQGAVCGGERTTTRGAGAARKGGVERGDETSAAQAQGSEAQGETTEVGVALGDLFDQSYTPDGEVVAAPTSEPLDLNITELHSVVDVQALAEKIRSCGIIAFDTETTGVDPLMADLVAMSFALGKDDTYFLLLPEDRVRTLELLAPLKDVFASHEILKVGQNIKYDLMVLARYGVTVGLPLFDTMVAHYLLYPDMRHGLDELSERHLGIIPMSFEQMIAPQSTKQPNLRAVPHERLRYYAVEDAALTFRLYKLFAPMLEERGQTSLFQEIEMPLIPVLASMEQEGVRLDTEVLSRISRDLNAKLLSVEEEIFTLSGHPFNVNSSKQVGELLFDELKIIDKPKKTKSGGYTTSEEVLEKLRGKHPIVGKILDYRGLKKLLSTYVDALPELLYPDGRLHTSFNQTVAATGRLSSTNPNIQNIPIRTDEGRAIRAAFVPHTEEDVFVSADYSQIELRLMAHISGDEGLIEAFRSGQDIHEATAAKIHGIDISEVTSQQRREAKTANFGIIYGISAFGLADRLGISRTEAKKLIEGYFATYPGVQRYMEQIVLQAREEGYVSTILGRRRYLPDISSGNAIVRGYAERNAINAPLQGTAADIIKIAMIRIYREIRRRKLRSRMILQVHDELNFNVPKDEVEVVVPLIRQTMQDALAALSIPLEVAVGIGENWLEAH